MAFNEFLTLCSSIPTWVIITFVLFIVTYLFLTRNFGYWEKQGVKVSTPWPVIGSMSFSKLQMMDEMDATEYKKHGRVFGYYFGSYPMLMVGEPEMIKKILVKDFHLFRNHMGFDMKDDIMMNVIFALKNDEWKRVRNILTPTFTTGKLKQMIVLIEECAQQLIKHLQKFESADEPFEARQCCASFAVDVIATCAFGTKINSLENPDNEFIQNAKKIFSFPSRLFLLAFISEKLFGLLAPYFAPDNKSRYFVEILQEVIKSRAHEKEPRKDFLQLLLEAELTEENSTDNNKDTTETTTSFKRKILTRNQLLAQAIMFLAAGSETVAITFCLTLYTLALEEECQEKLIEEIERGLKDNENDTLNYDIIAQMQYLDMVICETLRMYPPIVRLDRVCEEDGYKLTENITLKKGMTVGVPIYAMHHDEEFYPNPHKFDPERFSPENRSKRDPYTYLPFGFGPRNCIGMRFALLELKIGLIHFLREFRVKRCSKTEVPFKRDFSLFIQPSSVYLKLEKRKR